MSNNNEKDDNLTVSRVYETLKSPTFLKNLYWDILSGIKEKNTYKLMREIAEGVIDQNMEVLHGLNSNTEADKMHRKTILAEISVMSYTIDKVFSKILYMKLEKVCKEHIVKIIQELKDEGKIPEDVWSRFKINIDTTGSQTSATDNKVVKTKEVQRKKLVQIAPTRVATRRRKVTSNYNIAPSTKKADSKREILDDLKKVNGEKYTEDDKDSSSSKKGYIRKKKLGRRVKGENMPSAEAGSSSKNIIKENLSILPNCTKDSASLISKEKVHNDNQDDSDAESEISIGRVSSVSSVHTSDLSSFDDEISLSSDDENGQKKKVPLKEALKKYSEHDHSNCNPDIEVNVKSEPKVTMNNATKIVPQATSFDSPNENGISKRARKPNSRYSSGNMLCPAVKVKERKKLFPPVRTYGKNSSGGFPPQNKKVKVDDDDIYVDVVTITQSINEGNSNNTVNIPTEQTATPDLFQPPSASRSLTSRRTAPVTLFST